MVAQQIIANQEEEEVKKAILPMNINLGLLIDDAIQVID